jgi:hypothetical protein
MGKKIQINSGDKYGRLTIVKEIEPYVEPNGRKRRRFNCVCDCGNEKNIVLPSLTRGLTNSCGCYNKEITTLHGLWNHPLYPTWNGIKNRCYNLTHKHYYYYGGREIKMCNKWLNSFEDFIKDMGEKPTPLHSIDRINNDGNYEPLNCRWATKKEQANNRRNGRKKI